MICASNSRVKCAWMRAAAIMGRPTTMSSAPPPERRWCRPSPAQADADADVEDREPLRGPAGGQRLHAVESCPAPRRSRGRRARARPQRPKRATISPPMSVLDGALVREDDVDHRAKVLVEQERMVTGPGVDSMRRVKPRMSANRTVADRHAPGLATSVPSASARSASRGRDVALQLRGSASRSDVVPGGTQAGQRLLQLQVPRAQIAHEPLALGDETVARSTARAIGSRSRWGPTACGRNDRCRLC